MWRLVAAELANKCVVKGQRILFIGTIKAQIKAVYVRGKKVRSAFCNDSTKPIFRSESARYVLFVQMSKEMWDFDADGTGEIMFSKVVNGFLPELFKRWKLMKARHLITIVLFTRLEYQRELAKGFSYLDLAANASSIQCNTGDGSYKDFYRVVVSDMASTEFPDILSQLKKEFKVFLKDVSIRKPGPQDHISLGTGLAAASADLPDRVIAGRPSAATRGNILEAINLACLHFSSDYIDRDLNRTGVSIAVVTPGTGLFEVDYNLLVKTTDNLVENGIGIDLVCLSRMPLHSVPLFKYQQPGLDLVTRAPHVNYDYPGSRGDTGGSSVSVDSHGFPAKTSVDEGSLSSYTNNSLHSTPNPWRYAIPHWVDVSFWASSLEEGSIPATKVTKPTSRSKPTGHQHKAFAPRVRMYELQMMGVMETAASGVFCPSLPLPPKAAWVRTKGHKSNKVSDSYRSPPSNYLRSTPPGRHAVRMSSRPRKSSVSTGSTGGKSTDRMLNLVQWMDEYDEIIFQNQNYGSEARKKNPRPIPPYYKSEIFHSRKPNARMVASSPSMDESSPKGDKGLGEHKSFAGRLQERELTFHISNEPGSITSNTSISNIPRLASARFSRQVSFGLRGFGAAPPKAIASTELSSDHANSTPRMSGELQPGTATRGKGRDASVQKALISEVAQKENSARPGERSLASEEATLSVHENLQKSSRPIPIRKPTSSRIARESDEISSRGMPDPTRYDREQPGAPDHSVQHESNLSSRGLATCIEAEHEPYPSSIIAPWLTIINPSNPYKTNINLAGRLGRWQHVFPRPLRTSKFKWKSLCSPAAIPFTTEDFPTADQLATNYQHISYQIESLEDDEASERHRPCSWRLREMIAFRFSQGFQVVVGPNLAKAIALQTFDVFDIFASDDIPHDGSNIVLSKNSAIHQLMCVGSNKIEIKCFSHEPVALASTGNAAYLPVMYGPAIRTMLDQEYVSRSIRIGSECQRGQKFAWEKIDRFLAGHGKQQPDPSMEGLCSWRARFVLIPIDPPSSTRRPLHSINEDNEEEIRLEGIKKLSQVWQRFRYVPPDERRFQATTPKRKDPNPLDIIYQTRNPSAIVAAELDSIGENDPSGRPVQLLPDSELYQRSNLNLASLAQTIQGEKGVRLMDRRWHLRLHYNCFIGFELTTWLFQNFKDVETREEAVELGNELMKGGLFQHVEQRHNFRDGNFFYQVASDYRTPRPESRSNWFGSRRTDRSVPPTPGSDGISRDSSKAPGSRSGPIENLTSETEPTTPTATKRRLGVALSKSLLYDVDHRKRSYRPELINLHYDRLHNPDNCYHIRIEWMNTTSKLIEDAVVSWATSVDRFGLRLVEVPISEASTVTDIHPFRAPYLVKLAKEPPRKQPQDYFDATSFAPVPQANKHVYQKAIMKKFNFVIDFEAAGDFPSDVDVTYSWGKPDYRFPQYIHRSGVLLAQITDEGNFLLLANKLYTNRSAASDAGKQDIYEMQDRMRFGPARSSNHRGSPRSSPFSSPLVRATFDMPTSTHTTISNPAQIKAEFEAFCRDSSALAKFYNDVLGKALSPAPNTPFMEASIPAFGLPPSMALKETSPTPRSSARQVESGADGSPKIGAIDPI